jgi:hypothetical protein
MTKERVPNQLLEFTIHPVCDEVRQINTRNIILLIRIIFMSYTKQTEISRSPSPKELPRVEDDIIGEIRIDVHHDEEVQSGKGEISLIYFLRQIEINEIS